MVRATFGVDVHATSADLNQGNTHRADLNLKVLPYDIPLRAMIAKDVDGLMMAGRCISADFISQSSYRVTGNAVGMGEGTGVIGAIAALSKRMPHEVPWSEGVQKLREKSGGRRSSSDGEFVTKGMK